MTIHIIGTRINGERARFSRELSDEEFFSIVEKVGGRLPDGYWAWHVHDPRNPRSAVCMEIEKLPIVLMKYDWLPTDPVLEILYTFYRDCKETCEDCKKHLTVKEEITAYSLGDGICSTCREERYTCGH